MQPDGTSKLRVVIADDVEDLRYLLDRALVASGRFEVVGTAANGRQAIDIATEQRPDLTLLDLAMPLMDGLEALPHIRAAVPDGTVVVLSGFDAETMESTALERGAAGYLVKGLSPRRLVDELIVLCDSIERQRGQAPDPTADGDVARATIELPADLTSGRRARLFLAERLAEWRLDSLLDTAMLLTTELVTNAVIHARSEVTVTIRRAIDSLRVEVADTGGGSLQMRPASIDATSGRGLQLMDSLAAAWGTSAFDAGKLVWFELPAAKLAVNSGAPALRR